MPTWEANSRMQDAGLDPFEQVINGAVTSKKVNLGLCQADAGISYGIHHLTGLSGLKIEKLDITAAQVDDVTSGLVLDISASINKHTLTAKVDGSAYAHCGILRPKIGVSGKVIANQVDLNGLGKIFDPILDEILFSVQHVFKSKIQNLVNNLIKEQAGKLISSKLPISVGI